jgi:beta-aspartyl-peptidase (threonine type)
MKKIVALSVIFLVICAWSFPDEQNIEREIRGILAKQKASWNEHDIEGFMEYYWRSEDFTFQSGSNRILGWNALLARYKTNYSGENMGTLDFTDIIVTTLSEKSVLVLGRWEVKRKDETLGGLFTIVLQHKPKGWRIIHDHTS